MTSYVDEYHRLRKETRTCHPRSKGKKDDESDEDTDYEDEDILETLKGNTILASKYKAHQSHLLSEIRLLERIDRALDNISIHPTVADYLANYILYARPTDQLTTDYINQLIKLLRTKSRKKEIGVALSKCIRNGASAEVHRLFRNMAIIFV